MRDFTFKLFGLTAAMALTSCGLDAGDSSPTPTPMNHAPIFTSSSTVSVEENTLNSFYAAAASDADGNPLTYSIAGGPDAAVFSITSAGALSFKAAPDFEAPIDQGGDNVYNVNLAVGDGQATATLPLTVTVTNVVEQSTMFSMQVFWTYYERHSAILPIPNQPNIVHFLPYASNARQFIEWLQTSGSGNGDPFVNSPGSALAASPDVATTRNYYSLTVESGFLRIVRNKSDSKNYYSIATQPTEQALIWKAAAPYNSIITAWMGFGPDGLLYILLADAADTGGASNRAQDPNSVFGKILRIDVSRDGFPSDVNRNYAIPADNPFASSGGAPEIWSLGVHQPRAISFASDGNLFFVDGGASNEEVNLLPPNRPGLNFGWPVFDGTASNEGGTILDPVAPVAQYAHSAMAGPILPGFVYDGWITELKGLFLFVDSTNDHFWALPANSLTLGKTLSANSFRKLDEQFKPTGAQARAYGGIDAIGYDLSGNIIINGKDGAVWRSKPR